MESIKKDTSENQVKLVYLGIGSNLGRKKKNIEKAKFELVQADIKIIKSSSYYESLSWPNTKNPKFLNIVLKISTKLEATDLLKKCKKIEYKLGRREGSKNSPRLCDIDILDYDKKTEIKDLVIPHPRMHRRNFVLMPLFELDKRWIHPVLKKSIKELILSLSNKDIRSIKQI